MCDNSDFFSIDARITLNEMGDLLISVPRYREAGRLHKGQITKKEVAHYGVGNHSASNKDVESCSTVRAKNPLLYMRHSQERLKQGTMESNIGSPRHTEDISNKMDENKILITGLKTYNSNSCLTGTVKDMETISRSVRNIGAIFSPAQESSDMSVVKKRRTGSTTLSTLPNGVPCENEREVCLQQPEKHVHCRSYLCGAIDKALFTCPSTNCSSSSASRKLKDHGASINNSPCKKSTRQSSKTFPTAICENQNLCQIKTKLGVRHLHRPPVDGLAPADGLTSVKWSTPVQMSWNNHSVTLGHKLLLITLLFTLTLATGQAYNVKNGKYLLPPFNAAKGNNSFKLIHSVTTCFVIYG